jgi:amino acid adenylation domain-containing protein
MIPTDILITDNLPYLASGKVDRRALQDLHQEFRESQDQQPELETDADTRHLAELFSDVLKIDVLRLPSISAAGIDSLSSIRIASRLRDNGYPNVGATDILEARSLSELRDRLLASDANVPSKLPAVSLLQRNDMQSVLESHDLLSAHMRKIQDIVPCTPVQSAMLSETARSPRAYCNWIELQANLRQSVEGVKKAVHALIHHHEMLRTGFAVLHDAQHPYASVVWQDEHDCRTLEVAEFDYEYTIENESQLLVPQPVQLRSSTEGTSILFQLHHSLYDQWSIDIIKDDLDLLLQGKKLSSQPSYNAVASYHLRSYDQAIPEAQMEYWQAHLRQAAATPLPQLNGQKCTSNLQRTGWLPLKITTASVRQKATDINSSAPAIFQAAYSYLLSLYTGASDVVYGTVFSGRHIPIAGVERMVGPCLATLPSRTDIGSVKTCQDLIQTIHSQNRGMIKHSDTPLVQVKQIGRYAPNENMFDTLFVWQESTFAKPTLVTEVDSADQHELNLVLEVEPRAEHVAVRVTYSQSCISSTQVASFVEQLQYIALQLIDHPQTLVSELVKALPTHTLAIDNPHPTTHSHKAGLVSALENVAERMPSAPALVCALSLEPSSVRTQSLTYQEMHTRANRLARHLIDLDVQPDDLVCVCMDKSIELYVTILAVLKAGAGYVPLLPDTPTDRVKSILDQTSPKVFLCDGTVSKESCLVVETEIVDLSTMDLRSFSGDNLALPYCGSHAAYSIFTSGSTGTPKGLVVTQDNLLGNLSTLANIYPVDPQSRLLQACSQAFDVSVFEIFFAFFTGMPLCFARKDDLFQDIEHAIRSLEITHLSLTPTVAALVDPENVPSVRFLVTAGEAMTDFVHRKWAGKGLHQGYGPSETTNICTVNAQMLESDIISNIGPAFPNTSAFVIHPSKPFEILPLGAVGEFAFGGEQVFRGYIGRNELNAEKIIAHPEYGRVYRSGDIGRMLPGGNMLISGRLDDQVKVRGNRVELGEINASMLSNQHVEDCTTMILGKDSTTQSIASFWTPTGGSKERFEVMSPTEQLEQQVTDIYQRLEGSLPPYMVPTVLIPVTTLPRTTQGKLDRRLLESAASILNEDAKNAYFRSAGQAQGGDEEWTVLERDLAAALATVIDLPLTDIGRNTSFFALGVNSINAIAYAKALGKHLDRIVSVGSILRNTSVARLSSSITSDTVSSANVAPDPSKCFSQATISDIEATMTAAAHRVKAILPCTPLQEAMLSAGHSQTDSAYSNRTKFKVTGDLRRLKKCLQELVKRHAILRTRFFETSEPDHPFAQVVFEQVDLPWLEHSPTESINGREAEDISLVSMNCPFCLSTETEGDDKFIVFYMHHAIYDGTSMALLLEEAEKLYNKQALPPAPSFKPFLGEMQTHAGSTAMSFWSSLFQDYSAKPFPSFHEQDHPRVRGRIKIPLAVSQDDFEAFSKRHDVSAATIFQTAWAKVLALAQNASDVCFGDVVSGRSVPVADVDRLVAPCFNTLPVRVSLRRINDNLGLMRALHQLRLAADSHQLTPLRRIQTLSQTPDMHLFDSLLLVQPPGRDLDEGIWLFQEEDGLMDLPLVIEIAQSHTLSDLVVHYDGHHVSQATASMLSAAFASSLEDCLRFPLSNVRDITGVETHSLNNILATRLVSEPSPHTSNGEVIKEVWTETELLVRQAFSHFANIDTEKIHRHTSLYRLGLDSLHAVQVASRLRSQGISMTAADIMEHRTPAALAVAATAASKPEDRPEIDLVKYDLDHRSAVLGSVDISESVLESLRPCTPAQNGMISQSLQSQGALYVNHVVYEVPEGITEGILCSAWQQVQRKHQALRMGFVQTEESHCPFAMIIYRKDEVELTFKNSMSSKTEVGAAIVENMHRPAWQVAVDLSSDSCTMTISMHHALYDAESLQVLLRDLVLAIKQRDIGRSSGIDGVLRSMLAGAGKVDSEAEQFWRKSLENSSPSPFPNLNPVITNASDLYTVQKMSGLSYASLESLCKTRGCTIQAAGQTSWALLLSAYLGEAGVTFGTVFSGRTGSQHDSVIFPSLATVPVFCNAAKGGLETLQDMTDFNSAAQRHKHVALSDLQRFANLSGQALFDTVFVYQKSSGKATNSFEWRILEQSAAVDYNVSLELETMSTEVSLVLTVNRGVVPKEHARLLLEQYDHLLEQVLSGSTPPDPSLVELYSASPAKCPTLPSPVQLLHEFVEEAAQRTPDRPALEFAWDLSSTSKSRRVWSYRELDDRANQVAHLLQAKGVKSGDIIAVCMQKCPEASFAFIGILKAGCAFLAMDPELPQARKDFILNDSDAAVLLVDRTSGLSSSEASTKVVDLCNGDLDTFPPSAVTEAMIDPQATCYCLYTSGTTGTPKGCELTHENAVQAMTAFQKLFTGRWNENSRWLQFASYWFDVSVLEQFWSWSVGITLVGAPRDLVLDDITLFIQRLHITHIDLTPSLARILDPEDVPGLWDGVFITGGEALKQEIIEKWGSHRAICNGYGPTEATIGVTMNPFIGPDAKASNIGPAFLNVGSYVFAPGTTTPVLLGAVGELCVSGKLVGKGYLNRPELTAKAFPILRGTGEKIYRTGDLVRQVANGSFLFIGRQDSQAKLRGQRLEIDEIDSVIKQSTDSIADLASLVVKSRDKETLVSFFITEVRKQTLDLVVDDSEVSQAAVRAALQWCRSRLPSYMVPTHIIPLNVIPLTVNNKIDAKRLTAFHNGLSVSTLQSIKGKTTSSHALGPDAEKICKVLGRMLSIDVQGVDAGTNIFSLGMSSVSAITFATLLKRDGFLGANVTSIMRNPTIGGLADALSQDIDQSQDLDSVRQAQMSMEAFGQRYRTLAATRFTLDFEDIEIVAPCTPLQQGLILESFRSEQFPYFNEFTFVVDHLDIARLQHAFQQIVGLVQPLRTKFIQTDDGYAQVILKRQETPWYHEKCCKEDFRSVGDQRRQQWLMHNQSELASPFEISIIETQQATHLTVYIHHALYDGISFDMIMERVAESYCGRQVDCGPKFTDALPYGPLCKAKDADVFWKRHLGNLSTQGLPLLPGIPPAGDPVETSAFYESTGLDGTCKSLGVSHQAVLQACFAVALHGLAPEVSTYGTVVSGRAFAFEEADHVLGPLFNTVPSPLHLQLDDTWSSLIQRCHGYNVTALPYQHTPLRDIKKWCGHSPSDPVFDTIFVFQNLQTLGTSSKSDIWKPVQTMPKAEYPLAFELELDSQNGLKATVIAKRNVATKEMLRRVLGSFEKSLSLLTQDSGRYIKEHFQVSATSDNTNGRADDIKKSTLNLNGVHNFLWTEEAKRLRSEISKLAALDESEVDEHSSLFSLGLDSIDAVKLASRLKKIDMMISVSALIRAQTIPNILSSLQRDAGGRVAKLETTRLQRLEQQLPSHITFAEPLDSTQVERILPATPSQEALVSEMIRSDFHQYYNHDVLRLGREVDLERLLLAWESVIRQSSILRTSFAEVASPDVETVYAQVIHAPQSFRISHVELKDTSAINSFFEHDRAIAKRSLSVTPLTQLTSVTAASERYLILSLAHAQYDGHSLALLHQDVQRVYSGRSAFARPPPDALIEASLAAVDSQALSFWRNKFMGASVARVPQANPDANSNTLHRVESVSAIAAQDARAFCRSNDVSLQSLAQSAWALTLAHHIGYLDVIFGAVLACRDSEEAEDVLFPLMNTVPMRATLHGTRREMVRHMQDVNTDVLAYQRTPLRYIQRAAAGVLHLEASSDRNALFDTLFIYQHRPEAVDQQEQPLYESVGGSSDIEYPVAVEMEAVGERFVLRAACKHTVLDEDGARKLLQTFDKVLKAIIRAPGEPTVKFVNSQASICGLPVIKIKTKTAEQSPRYGEDESEDPELASSPEAATIRDALCQVSKTPPGELSDSSTIESIGIDSISAIKVVALLRKQGVKISVGELIRAKTVAHMAKVVQDRETASSPGDGVADDSELVTRYIEQHKLADVPVLYNVDAGNIQTILPALPGQTYMLNVWQATKGLLFYPTFNYRISNNATETQLRCAWEALVNKYDILRTVFCQTNDAGIPIIQAVLRKVPSAFTSGSEQQSNTSQQPMAHLHVARTSTAWDIRLSVHHALYDAVSLPLLMEDFEELLAGSSPVSSPVSQANFLAPSLTPRAQTSRREFWKDYLSNMKTISLPQPEDNISRNRVEIFKPAFLQSTGSLEAKVRKEGLTVQSLLFAAYARVYAQLAHRSQHGNAKDDVVIGIYLSGRSHIEHLSTLRSPTLNLLPLLVRSAGTVPLVQSARQIQHDLQMIGTLENSAASLWEIAALTGVRVDTFVNFQRLSDVADKDEHYEGSTLTNFELVEVDRLATRSRVVNNDEGVHVDFRPAKELPSMARYMHGAYLVSADRRLEILLQDFC